MPKHNHNWLFAGEKTEGNQRIKFFKCNLCGIRTMRTEKLKGRQTA